MDLSESRISAEEIRKAGHRATLQDIEEGQRQARALEQRARIARERRRIESAPIRSPSEIREKREALGVRQRDVANFSGLSIATVNGVETGRTENPEEQTLRRIAVVLEDLEQWRATV